MMTTELRTDLTVADICNGFVYNELEGKGLYGWGGRQAWSTSYSSRRFRMLPVARSASA